MKLKIETKMVMFAILLLMTSLHIQAQSSGTTAKKAKLTVEQKQVLKQQKERENKLELMYYYGLSDSRYEEYQRIQKNKRAKIKAVRELNLSKEARISKIEAIASDGRAQLKQFFTPRQYALYELRVSELKKMKVKQNACLKQYKVERKSLSYLPRSERSKAMRELNARYIQNLSIFVAPDKAKKEILDVYYFRLGNSAFVKKQKLPKKQVIALGRVIDRRDFRMEEVKTQLLLGSERKKRIQEIKKWEKKRLAEILGVRVYASYVSYQNKSHEHRYKTKYGFTDADYSAYKRIENNFAIKVMAIKKSEVMQTEKKQKIAMAKEEKVKALRKALPPHAFEKWHKGDQDRITKSTKKTVRS